MDLESPDTVVNSCCMEEGIRSASHGVLGDAQVEAIWLEASDGFPSSLLPVLLYRGAFAVPRLMEVENVEACTERAARMIEKTFARHHWSGGWRDGIYDYHHFHSTAHEVLGCFGGRATVQVGGPHGPHLHIAAGDVLVLPAGASHKCVTSTPDFRVVGAYERGRAYDMQIGDPAARRGAEQRIREVPAPELDPIYGAGGPLVRAWRASVPVPRAHKHDA
jgi:uncharacterized protein YjlB